MEVVFAPSPKVGPQCLRPHLNPPSHQPTPSRIAGSFSRQSLPAFHASDSTPGDGFTHGPTQSVPTSAGLQCLRPHLNPSSFQPTPLRIAGSFWRQHLPLFHAGDSTRADGFSHGPTQSVPTSVGLQCLRPHLNPSSFQPTPLRIAGSFWRQHLPPFPTGDSMRADGFR